MCNPKYAFRLLVMLLAGSAAGCDKTALLSQEPTTGTFIPQTIEDYESLLDNELLFSQTPMAGVLSAGETGFTNGFTSQLSSSQFNLYTWQTNIYESEENVADWNVPYEQVFYANQVLEGIDEVKVGTQNRAQIEAVKGTAYFFRAYAFYQVAQLYAPVYVAGQADTLPGIPLRTSIDVDEVSKRATLQQTYDQLIGDLRLAVALLPSTMDKVHRNRPAAPSAWAMLARVYLSMSDYRLAEAAADSCLGMYSTLMDFNDLDVSQALPFAVTNEETLYQSKLPDGNPITGSFFQGGGFVDSSLYQLYAADDLRQRAYFMSYAGYMIMKGSYYGTLYPFTGLAVDEVFLIKAECLARRGEVSLSLQYLHTLLGKRWKTGRFVPFETSDATEALQLVLRERQKELALRGLRWSDLRRLNKTKDAIKLTRLCKGQTFELAANDLRYTLPIPPKVIQLSGMQQNPR